VRKSRPIGPACWCCRIAPGALLHPGPPRNRTGTFQRIRLEQAVEIRGRGAVRSAHWGGSSAGPFTAACAVASNLSVGAGAFVIFFSLAHLTASARFRAGPQGSVFGRLCGTTAWRGQPSCPGFPLRFRRRPSLLGHPMPAEELGSPHGRLTSPKAGPRRGYRFPHARAATGVGASYTPRTAVLIPAEGRTRPAPAALPRPVPVPRSSSHPSRAVDYEASIGGLGSSPVRPAPRLLPPDGSGALGLSLELRTPPLPAAHVEGGARSSEHGPGTTRSHQLILQSGSSLVSCDRRRTVLSTSQLEAGVDFCFNQIVCSQAASTTSGETSPCWRSGHLAVHEPRATGARPKRARNQRRLRLLLAQGKRPPASLPTARLGVSAASREFTRADSKKDLTCGCRKPGAQLLMGRTRG
jgi:hypothetical protein